MLIPHFLTSKRLSIRHECPCRASQPRSINGMSTKPSGDFSSVRTAGTQMDKSKSPRGECSLVKKYTRLKPRTAAKKLDAAKEALKKLDLEICEVVAGSPMYDDCLGC